MRCSLFTLSSNSSFGLDSPPPPTNHHTVNHQSSSIEWILHTLASITKHIRRSERPQQHREISTNSYNKKQHLPPFGNISSSSSTPHVPSVHSHSHTHTHVSALLEFTFPKPIFLKLVHTTKTTKTSNNNNLSSHLSHSSNNQCTRAQFWSRAAFLLFCTLVNLTHFSILYCIALHCNDVTFTVGSSCLPEKIDL